MSEVKKEPGAHPFSDEQVIDYCLGELSESVRTEFEEHLSACPECSMKVAEYSAATDRLLLSRPPIAPPPSAKTDILRAVQGEQNSRRAHPRKQQPAESSSRGGRTARRGIFIPLPLAAAVIFAVIASLSLNLILGLVSPAGRYREVVAMLQDGSGNSSGVILLDPDKQQGRLIIQRLPELPADLDYQLWIIDDGNRVSASVFDVDEAGDASLSFASSWLANPDAQFGITIEPAGGSPLPTGPRVMSGKRTS